MTNMRESLSLLAGLEQSKYMVSNLYLRLMPEDRADKKYLVSFKNMVKKQREYLLKRNLEKEVLEAVEEDFKLMEEFLSEPENLKGCRGIAIFPKSEEDILDEAIEEALDQRATVEVIIDKELQRKVDGLGAFLRFPI